jgi:hypothetical protein
MLALLTALVALGLVTAGVTVAQRYYRRRRGIAEPEEEPVAAEPEVCCGQHAVCEKDSLLAAVSKEIEYYDDEELDRWAHTPSDEYTDEAVEEFRNIFYTMAETDVAGWVRSLQLREIELPDDIKDEVFLVVGERRMPH